MRSTRSSVTSLSPTRWSEDVTTLTTPAGMSVRSAIRRPSLVAFQGVSGAGLMIVVLPVARVWPSLLMVISTGKFQGTIEPTTPTGSFHTRRRLGMPNASRSPRSRSQANSSIIFAGQRSPSSRGASSCGP